LGNKFLSHIREVDAIVHVVRCFEGTDVVHVDGSIDPKRDIDTINLELILSDMDTVEKRLDKAKKSARGGDAQAIALVSLLEQVYEALKNEKPARSVDLTPEQKALLDEQFLLTTKPIIYAANIAETDLGTDENDLRLVARVREIAKEEKAEVLVSALVLRKK
jgi:ribosome-binding ATPase YchF (GTP1/OBG family)